MDADRYSLRELRDADYVAWAAVHTAIFPDRPTSADSLRQDYEAPSGDGIDLPRFAVEDRPSGEPVAFALLFRNPFHDDPGSPWIVGEVRPDHQGQGIGSHLYTRLLSESSRHGVTGFRCNIRDFPPTGREFLEKRGFVERRRNWYSELDVATANTADLPAMVQELAARGIGWTTLAREGPTDLRVLHRVHELEVLTAGDVPRVGAYIPVSFDRYRRYSLDGRRFLPEAWFLAKAGDRYVGITAAALEPANPGVLLQQYTATDPAYRGRKIALTLKLLLIEYAQRERYRRIETSNDSLNERMWAINRRLGFQKLRENLVMENLLPGATTGETGSGRRN